MTGALANRKLASAFARSSIFSELPGTARDDIEHEATLISLEPRALLFAHGDAADAAFLIVDGEVEVSTTSVDGRVLRLTALGPGAIVGELALLDGAARSADVHAVTRVRLLCISRASIMKALDDHPAARRALLATLADRLRAADVARESAAWSGLSARLAKLLLDERGAGELVQLSQTELARRIGAARESVNRTLSAWRDAGLVEISRKGVRLRAIGALGAIAGSTGGD